MKKWDNITESEIPHKSENCKAPSWYNNIHGVNYIASYSRNSYEMWKHYEPEIIERELGYAVKVGFDSVRIYLNYRAWSEDPLDFIKNFRHFLKASSRLGLLVNPTMFDGCGVEDGDITTQTTTVGNRYENVSPLGRKFLSRGHGKKYVENYLWDRVIPDLEDDGVLFWEFWAPSPGPSRMGEDYWPLYEKYCIDLIKAANIDNVILAWDVMNEPPPPDVPLIRNDYPELIEPFLYHFVEFVQKRARGVPVLVGLAEHSYPQVNAKCDIICFHSYNPPPLLQRDLKKAKRRAYKLKKPLLCNECLSYFLFHERPDEQNQLDIIKKQYEIFEKENVGWMAWQLMEGEMFLPYCGFVRRDGSLKPAAEYLKDRILQRF